MFRGMLRGMFHSGGLLTNRTLCEYVSGYASKYVSRYASGHACIGGVKHAPFHKFLTRHFWKQVITVIVVIRIVIVIRVI